MSNKLYTNASLSIQAHDVRDRRLAVPGHRPKTAGILIHILVSGIGTLVW